MQIIERDAASARLWQCAYCTAGYRRTNGIHLGQLDPGPGRACERVFAAHGGQSTDDNMKPYLAYVDGEPLKNKSNVPRRFSSAESAYRAACRAAPDRR